MPETSCIVLRLTPFRENTFIAGTVSPEYGRLDLYLPGVRRTGKKKFPSVALFRELAVDFKEPRGGSELCSPRSLEPLVSHDDLANHTEVYLAACSLGAFLLRNSRPRLEMRRSFRALSTMLTRSASAGTAHPFLSYARLVYLHENGYVAVPPDRENVLQMLFEFAEGRSAGPPPFSASYTEKLVRWIDALASLHCAVG